MIDALDAFNQALFLQLNAGANPSQSALFLATLSAKWLMYLVPPLMSAGWLWGTPAQRNLLLRSLATIVLALLFSQAIRYVLPHPRPFAIGLGHAYLAHEANASFPSNHMSIFMALSLSQLFAQAYRLGSLCLLAAFAAAWGRIYLGVHFPLDMLGGIFVAGLAWVLIAWCWTRWGSPCLDLAERAYRRVFALPIRLGYVRA